MPQLLARHWRVIAKALRFVRDLCSEDEAQEILTIIGEEGEKAATPGNGVENHADD